MTSTRSHLASEKLANSAHEALLAKEIGKARALFADAARAETEAFDAVPEGKARTLGILAVSAAALWFKADEWQAAELFIHRALANASLPPFARHELREVLQTIWDMSAPPHGANASANAKQRHLVELIHHCMEAKRLAETDGDSFLAYLLAMAIQEMREVARRQTSSTAVQPLRSAATGT